MKDLGRLDSDGPVEKNGLFTIKGRNYRAKDLLGDDRDGDAQAEVSVGIVRATLACRNREVTGEFGKELTAFLVENTF